MAAHGDLTIVDVRARRVWDSRGRPTVEAELVLRGGAVGRAIAPAGASRGSGEATDRRDGGTALGGMDVTGAIEAVGTRIRAALIGRRADLHDVDEILTGLDPTPTRERLGGNATVAVSLAAAHACAAALHRPLWSVFDPRPDRIPRPEVQIIGGGAHAGRRVDVQDFMVVPLAATSIEEALVHVAEVYLSVGRLLDRRGPRLGVADEGGHWPAVAGAEDAIRLLTEGIERAGFTPGADVAISLDLAASEFERDGRYVLHAEGRSYPAGEWCDLVDGWVERYAICLVEDPASERRGADFRELTSRLSGRCHVVGDDLLVTDAGRIRRAAAEGACNAALIKPNQAGTVSAARAAHDAARQAGWPTIVSARSGETEDVSVAHLAVGWSADLIKVGSITRGERTAKWNELLRIDAQLGGLPLAPFPAAGN
jgi:enolase